MLARFRVLLPYSFCIPYHDYVGLKPQELQYDEYQGKPYPPMMAEPSLLVLLAYARLLGVSMDVLVDDDLELPERLPHLSGPEKNRR